MSTEISTPATDETATGLALVVERLALHPEVDVAKLEKIIELQERILRHQAKAAFDAAFAEMQPQIPTITERGEIIVEGRLRSKYATFEDIVEVTRPILARHGFAIRFRDEESDGKLRIVGILSHRNGHREEDAFLCAADPSGKKNDIQAIGSTRSYGKRYVLTSLLCIATRGEDNDGKSRRSPKAPDAPEGYDSWLLDMTAVADNGMEALKRAWEEASIPFRLYITKHEAARWAGIKTRALQKDQDAKRSEQSS